MNSTTEELIGLFVAVCGLMTALTFFGEILRARTDDDNPVSWLGGPG